MGRFVPVHRSGGILQSRLCHYQFIIRACQPAHPDGLSRTQPTCRAKAWPRLRDFLRKVTTLSFAYNMLLALGLVFFGRWVLWIYGEQYVVAYPALMALLVGFVFNYTLFWNRPLLLSLGLPEFPLKAIVLAGVIKLALAFPLVPRFGYVFEAVLLSFYYIASVGAIVWRGLKEIKVRMGSETPSGQLQL